MKWLNRKSEEVITVDFRIPVSDLKNILGEETYNNMSVDQVKEAARVLVGEIQSKYFNPEYFDVGVIEQIQDEKSKQFKEEKVR